jgi:non-specific serine/threonine protein kinase
LRPYWEISGLLREGRHWLTKVLDRFPGPSPERAWLLMTRGVLATFQGELGKAITDLELSTPMAEEHGEVVACALGCTYLSLALAFSGRHAEAAAMGAVAEERLHAIDHLSGLISLDIHMGYLHLLSGEPDLAIERCGQGLRRLGDGGERWARGYLQVITAMAFFLQGKHQECGVAARGSVQMKHELGDIVGTAYCLEMLAWLAAAQQRCERTAWLLGAADALWERAGKRLGGTAIMEDFHQRAAKAARGVLGEKRYAALFRDGAVRPLDLVIGFAVEDADELAAPGTRHPVALLTRREQQIAALIAEGLSSRTIAQRLVISKRTVDAHIAHIFTKLGVSSRVQLINRLNSPASR